MIISKWLVIRGVFMVLTIDARGLACPQPVVLTNNAFGESDEVTTVVDNEVAKENVTRLAQSKGFVVQVERNDGDFHLHLKREGPAPDETLNSSVSGPTVLLIASDIVGRGSDELGRMLMTAFVQVLHEITPRPDTILFMNSGVKLVAEGSQVIEDLRALEEKGAELLACGACLGYYDLKDKITVGQISNMYDIASRLFAAGKIINP